MKRYRLAVLKGILVLSGFLLCISNAIAQRYVFRATWGDLGSANTSIARAGGLYAYSDGSYIVTETQTNRLHRFSQAGVLIDSFGGTGTAYGQFWGPSSPVALSDGTLYIGDYLNERVQVFSPTGTYLWQFDGSTSTGGKFGKPHSLAGKLQAGKCAFGGPARNALLVVSLRLRRFRTQRRIHDDPLWPIQSDGRARVRGRTPSTVRWWKRE